MNEMIVTDLSADVTIDISQLYKQELWSFIGYTEHTLPPYMKELRLESSSGPKSSPKSPKRCLLREA